MIYNQVIIIINYLIFILFLTLSWAKKLIVLYWYFFLFSKWLLVYVYRYVYTHFLNKRIRENHRIFFCLRHLRKNGKNAISSKLVFLSLFKCWFIISHFEYFFPSILHRVLLRILVNRKKWLFVYFFTSVKNYFAIKFLKFWLT